MGKLKERRVLRSQTKPSKSFIGKINPFKNSIGFKLLIYYIVAILIGSILLVIPEVTHNVGAERINYGDAFFITTSAITDTGLTPVTVSEQFNIFGQIIIVLCIQIGGIGIMSAKYFIWSIVLGQNSSLSSKDIVHNEKGGTERSRSIKTITTSLKGFAIMILFSTILLSIYFFASRNNEWGKDVVDNSDPYQNYGTSLWYGFFHTISSINNAGFDVFGGRSLQAFQYDAFLQYWTIFLFLIGGFGFPVLYDTYTWVKGRFKNKKVGKLSILAKITIITYFLVMFSSLFMGLIIEAVALRSWTVNSSASPPLFADPAYNDFQKGMVVFFHTSSARSAGFSFYDIGKFSIGNRSLLAILMFIGAGPASTGGGIRVTSLAIIVVALVKFRRDRSNVNIFKTTIDPITRKSAFRTFIAATLMVVFVGWIITIDSGSNSSITAEQAFFEAVSAFGTTGLSFNGATESFSYFSKIMLCVIMIIGQVGINNVLVAFRSQGKNSRAVTPRLYATERIEGV